MKATLLILICLALSPFSAFAEKFSIEGSPKTPSIMADSELGVIVIQSVLKGRSIPENSIEFARRVEQFMDKYEANPASKTLIIVNLIRDEIKNPVVYSVFKKLESIHKGGSSRVTINWHYEEDDKDTLRTGEDFQAIINVPFRFTGLE